VGTLDVFKVLSLDANELYRRFSLWRVHRAELGIGPGTEAIDRAMQNK
jgi:hypothetical protein